MTTAAAPKANLNIRELEAAQARVKAQIESVQKSLKELQAHIPDSHPWITLKTVNRIEDLRAPQRSLRAALRDDIKKLQEQAQALQAELKAAKSKQVLPTGKSPTAPAPGVAKAVQQGAGLATNIVSRSVGAAPVKAVDQTPDPEIERLVKIAEDTANERIEALKSSASYENLHNALEASKQLALLGRSSERLDDAIQVAAGKRVADAVTDLRSNCTTRNIATVLNVTKEANLLGNEKASDEGMKAVADATVTMRKTAERQFRSTPTAENLGAYIKAMGEESLLNDVVNDLENPPGLPFVRPGTYHLVKSGETLQQISQLYFHSPGWWDVIVFRNFEAFRGKSDPSRDVVPGTRLKIA